MRIAHLIAGAAVAAITSLAFASPAAADNPALPINNDHVPTKAAGFQQECTEPFKDLPKDVDGWHFVLPGGGSFESVTLTFTTPGGVVVAIIDGTKDAESTGPGWHGYLDNAGATEKHAYVFTDAGWTLTAATASVKGEGQQGFFNLSHTCAGTPGTPSTPRPSPSPEPGDSTSPSASTSPGGDLPVTGTQVGGFVIAGVALLGGGVALLAVRRRRQITES